MGSWRPWIIAVIVLGLGAGIWLYGGSSGTVVNDPGPAPGVQPPADQPAADDPAIPASN